MAKYLKYNNQSFSVGDTVKVSLGVAEAEGKVRTQIFEGIIIAIDNRETGKCFTVRKIAAGVGVERIIPLETTALQNIESVMQGDVRRSKLFYLRGRTGKRAMKIKKAAIEAPKA